MPFRRLILTVAVLSSLVFVSCQGVHGNAEPYGFRPRDPVAKAPSLPNSPMVWVRFWLDPSYSCLKPTGERIFSPRNRFEDTAGSPKLLGDYCGNGARDVRPEEIERYELNRYVGIDKGIYESAASAPASATPYTELLCKLKTVRKTIEIAVKVGAEGSRQGQKLVVENGERKLVEGAVELRPGSRYVGNGFDLILDGEEGKLDGEADPMRCRTVLP